MFRIYFINHGYWAHEEPETIEVAKEIARKAGFEATIYSGSRPVLAFSPIGGFRALDRNWELV